MHTHHGAYDLIVEHLSLDGTWEVTASEILLSGGIGNVIATHTAETLIEAMTAVSYAVSKHEESVAYWYEVHEDEPEGTHEDLLDEKLVCGCCGVDYSGNDTDLND